MTDLAEVLVQHFEGCSLKAYKDAEPFNSPNRFTAEGKGFWTIGWGHFLDQSVDWTGHVITQEVADALLEQDMSAARRAAFRFPSYLSMNDVRQAVCVSMCFQLGEKPLSWPNFMDALGVPDFAAAAAAGRDSDWWRTETHARAELEMTMLQTGNWEIQT